MVVPIRNKKGVSVVIGYVLLISFGIILSVIVFNYLRTYVPSDAINCPDGVSLLVKDYTYNCTSGELSLEIKNRGRFNVEGYYIHGTESPSVELATADLSKDFNSDLSEDGFSIGNAVYFHKQVNNSFKFDEEVVHVFNLGGQIYSIEITPLRFQTEGGSEKVVSCGNAKLTQEVICSSGLIVAG
ncbi:MAG: hypothetical protein Q8Q04_00270 [archaeon]|nr:hypothetical protein [archaeon]